MTYACASFGDCLGYAGMMGKQRDGKCNEFQHRHGVKNTCSGTVWRAQMSLMDRSFATGECRYCHKYCAALVPRNVKFMASGDVRLCINSAAACHTRPLKAVRHSVCTRSNAMPGCS